ncbi:hypothetical protein HDV01_003870 [Terramyces sp. JEL0728]|nr:hypothetical protein HDV01_003870 [Terramyces sp. JEL0728]
MYNFNHMAVLKRFKNLRRIIKGEIGKELRDWMNGFCISNELKTDDHNEDYKRLLPVVLKVCNYADKLDNIITVFLKGEKDFKESIGNACIRDFLGIIWMKVTGYYEPMRYFRNAIAHNQYEDKRGDNNQEKVLFYNVMDGEVNWKLFCDVTTIRKHFLEFLRISAELFSLGKLKEVEKNLKK